MTYKSDSCVLTSLTNLSGIAKNIITSTLSSNLHYYLCECVLYLVAFQTCGGRYLGPIKPLFVSYKNRKKQRKYILHTKCTHTHTDHVVVSCPLS